MRAGMCVCPLATRNPTNDLKHGLSMSSLADELSSVHSLGS